MESEKKEEPRSRWQKEDIEKMDLQVHTTASDGKMTPAELLTEAKERGVRYLAITDHDTVDGYLKAREEAKRLDLHLIPGIEWNIEGPEGELHILGYGFIYPTRACFI